MEKRFYKFKASFPITLANLLPYFLSFVISIAGIIILITIIIPQTKNISGYIGLILFIIFFILLGGIAIVKGLLLIFGVGYWYAITNTEIIIKSGALSKNIPLKEIKKISKIDAREVEKRIFGFQKEIVKKYGEIPGIIESVPPWQKQRNLLKYCTNPIGIAIEKKQWWFGLKGISFGFPRGKFKPLKPLVSGNYFVLIELKNRKKYLITPKDINGFMKSVYS